MQKSSTLGSTQFILHLPFTGHDLWAAFLFMPTFLTSEQCYPLSNGWKAKYDWTYLDKQNQMQIWLLFGWFLLFINQVVRTVVATVNDCNACYCIYQTIFLYTIKSRVKLNLKHFPSYCLLVQKLYIMYHNSKAHKIKQKPKQIEKYKVCLDLICYNLVVINTWQVPKNVWACKQRSWTSVC
jgi:hypothetical protein